MESSRERNFNGLKLTHDEDEGGNDDDDFGQNPPRTAATLRTFLLHFRKSQGKQAATPETPWAYVFPLTNILFAFSDQRLVCIQRLLVMHAKCPAHLIVYNLIILISGFLCK
jgi:hypothetical protein